MNIGYDGGYATIKLVWGKQWITFPSVVGTPDKARFSIQGDDGVVLLEPSNVAVGAGAVQQSRFLNRREDEDWITSDMYYYLFLAALTELTKTTRADLRIVSGLPVAFYTDRNKQRLRDLLLGEHRVKREGRRAQTLTATDVRVIPQPFGCLLSEALDNQGVIRDSNLATGTVGVIDVGGKTTNILSVQALSEIARETTSVPLGAWDAVRAMRDHLSGICPGLTLRDYQVGQALIRGYILYYDQNIDLSDARYEILFPMAQQVVSQATQLWNGAAHLSGILIAGGGAYLLGEYIKAHFRHARIVENPVFANAVGYWKFAQRLGGRNDHPE